MDSKTLNKLNRLDNKIENGKRIRAALGAKLKEIILPLTDGQKMSEAAINALVISRKHEFESAALAIIISSMPKAVEGLKGQDIIDFCSMSIYDAAYEALEA